MPTTTLGTHVRRHEMGRDGYWRGVPGITWLIVAFALIVLAAGLSAMAMLTKPVPAESITALVTAVLGVVGTHVGHVSGHQLAARQAEEAKRDESEPSRGTEARVAGTMGTVGRTSPGDAEQGAGEPRS